MKTATAQKVYETNLIPLGKILVSSNVRRSADPEKLKELTESIRYKGVLQPVIVRKKGKGYELVCGHRRCKAAEWAGLKEIPAQIRDLTDQEVVEVQTIENLQREDLHPLDEAAGYDQLIRINEVNIKDVAIKVGKSEKYIYSRLRLHDLPEKAKELIRKDMMPLSGGLYLMTLNDEILREKAAEEFCKEVKRRKEAVTLYNIKQHIQNEYMLDLDEAPFDIKDEKLLKQKGNCLSCPDNSANQGKLFLGLEPDEGRRNQARCTLPSCFHAKNQATWEKVAEVSKKKGMEIISPKDSAKLFDNHWNGCTLEEKSVYVDLESTNHADPEYRTYKALLGKDCTIFVTQDPKGAIHHIVKKADAEKVIKEKYKFKPGSSSSSSRGDSSQAKENLRKAALGYFSAHLVEAIENQQKYDLKMLAKEVISDQGLDTCRFVARRRTGVQKVTQNWDGAIKDLPERPEKILDLLVDQMDSLQIMGLLSELFFVSHNIFSWQGGNDPAEGSFSSSLGKYYGMDVKGLRKLYETQAKDNKGKRKPQPTPEQILDCLFDAVSELHATDDINKPFKAEKLPQLLKKPFLYLKLNHTPAVLMMEGKTPVFYYNAIIPDKKARPTLAGEKLIGCIQEWINGKKSEMKLSDFWAKPDKGKGKAKGKKKTSVPTEEDLEEFGPEEEESEE